MLRHHNPAYELFQWNCCILGYKVVNSNYYFRQVFKTAKLNPEFYCGIFLLRSYWIQKPVLFSPPPTKQSNFWDNATPLLAFPLTPRLFYSCSPADSPSRVWLLPSSLTATREENITFTPSWSHLLRGHAYLATCTGRTPGSVYTLYGRDWWEHRLLKCSCPFLRWGSFPCHVSVVCFCYSYSDCKSLKG